MQVVERKVQMPDGRLIQLLAELGKLRNVEKLDMTGDLQIAVEG